MRNEEGEIKSEIYIFVGDRMCLGIAQTDLALLPAFTIFAKDTDFYYG